MKLSLAWAAAALAALATGAALAADPPYPTKPIKIISPFSPGGGTDILARLIQSHMAKTTGQTVVVENKPGANGLLGADTVAKSAPDGYTLLLGTVGTHGINAAMYKDLPYDTRRDFAPISMVAGAPIMVLTHSSVKANSIAELLVELKAKPMVYSSAGNGSVGHLAGELFSDVTGVEMIHAPYKGAAPALTDLLSGQVQLMFGTTASTGQYVKAGRIRALGITTARRSPLAPDIPTLTEQGVRGIEIATWYGLLAPAKTPKPVVDYLAKIVRELVNDPAARKTLLEQGLEPVGNTPEEFEAQIAAELVRWGAVARKIEKKPQ
jgi:tripartite-type tricarboxylate transporter receptor subunit TctC